VRPRDLTPLFEPRSLAIVGASANTEKWGYWFARDAAKGTHRRSVYLVGRSGGEVHGLPVHRSLAELPEPPELVVLAVPGTGLEDAVDEALGAGARALVAIAAGFGELSSDGAVRERAIAERVRAAGAVLVGPNCLGIFDSSSELELATADFPSGPFGFLSQSGNVGLETALLLEDVGLGYSRFVSVGNQADVEVTELLTALAEHEPTQVIGIYCEDFRDGRAFAEAARTAGKPVVLLTVGRTEAAVRAARSHTGALTSALDAVDAACRAAGIHRVDTPRELVDAVQALLSPVRPTGRRVGVISDGGGYGAIAADRLGSFGLELPVLGDETQERLRAVLPPTAATANPVDLAGGGEQDTFTFSRSTGELLASEDVDAVLFTAYYGGYSSQSDELREREVAVARRLADAVAETGKPLVVHTMHWDSPPARELRSARVPVYRTIESAVLGVAALVADTARSARPVPSQATPAAPVTDAGYEAARAALADAGIAFAPARPADDAAGALEAADELGFPIVLKSVGSLHKSDAGGVVVGIRGAEELAAALDRLAPPYSVERMEDVDAGFELLIGARRDPRFGPILLAGAGGVTAEILHDTANALAPVSEEDALALLRTLRCAPLLEGARGRPPLDLAAAAAALAALSRFAAAHPEVAEVEVNPLLVGREGAVGLDARVVPADQST
jgi:acetate---CoA ligase (ADP-forming)